MASIPHRSQPNMKGMTKPKPSTNLPYSEVMSRVVAKLNGRRKPHAILISDTAYWTLKRMGISKVRGLPILGSFNVEDQNVYLVFN